MSFITKKHKEYLGSANGKLIPKEKAVLTEEMIFHTATTSCLLRTPKTILIGDAVNLSATAGAKIIAYRPAMAHCRPNTIPNQKGANSITIKKGMAIRTSF